MTDKDTLDISFLALIKRIYLETYCCDFTLTATLYISLIPGSFLRIPKSESIVKHENIPETNTCWVSLSCYNYLTEDGIING